MGVALHAQEEEAGRSKVQGHPQLYSKIVFTLGYIKFCLKKGKNLTVDILTVKDC